MASATKVYSCKNLNPNLSLCALACCLSDRVEIHESTRQLCSRAGLPTRQLLPELRLKFENRVALNCISIVKSLRHEMKMLWVVSKLECLSSLLISPNPSIKGW